MSDDTIGSSSVAAAHIYRDICTWTPLDGPTVTTFNSLQNQFESTHEYHCPWWGFNHGSNGGDKAQLGSNNFLRMYGKRGVHRMRDLKFPNVDQDLRANKKGWAYFILIFFFCSTHYSYVALEWTMTSHPETRRGFKSKSIWNLASQ